jgi:phenylacetate-CoA ligase
MGKTSDGRCSDLYNMNEKLLKVYHVLPPPLRSVVASLRGYYLNSWRYNSETESLVEVALDRESWTPAQWKIWQENRISELLHRAATHVPFYREQWALRRRHGDKASWDYLENWPILEKTSLRENPSAFVADDCNLRRMFREHTSGTSGKPLRLWWSRKTVLRWYAICEARIRRWNGVSRYDRWGMIGGQLVTPVSQRYPPFWVWNSGLNQLYMSSYHLAPDLVGSYLEAIKRYRISYLYGYTSSLYSLAKAVLEAKLEPISISLAIANAEPVFQYQRAAISQAFNCPVRETYGMAEIVVSASECTTGRLHLWPEVGYVEVLGEEQSVPNGIAGDLVCTGLMNVDMPLIRYRTGDRGTLPAQCEICQCGRGLPLLQCVEGRIDDVLYTLDGRRVGRLDPLFKGDLPIHEAQIVQESLDCLRIRYIPTNHFRPSHEKLIIRRLHERMGAVKVIMEPMTQIPRESNGKFRAVISKLSTQVSNFS